MKRSVATFLLVVLLMGVTVGCGVEPTPTQTMAGDVPVTPTPTQTTTSPAAPTDLPTTAPTDPPTEVPTAPLTETPAESPTVTPETPPAGAWLGDTWTRPRDGMDMVYVPAGEFEMGSDNQFYNNERPPHNVELDGFWIDRTEVTNAQYQMCVKAGNCKPPQASHSFTRRTYYGHDTYDDYPVVYVSWYKAVAYCNWIGGRLPTEAEWEYVARGPEGRWYPWGDTPDKARLNYCDASCVLGHADPSFDDGYPDTSPVGSYPAGASWCGALDMVGNVWEWTWDWYGYYPSEDNPTWLATEMKDRVIRGGAWDTAAEHARCTFRNWHSPAKSHDSIGFRCVVSPSEEQAEAEPTVQPAATVQDRPETTASPTVDEIVAGLQGLSIDDFFEESYKQLLLRDPEGLTYTGLAEEFGLRNDRLTDISDAYVRETYALQAAILDILQGYDRDALTPEQQLSYDVYEWYLDDLLRGQPFMYYDYPVNSFSIFGEQNRIIDFFVNIHPIRSKQDAEDYITRLSQLDTKLGQLVDGLKLRAEAGIVAPGYFLEGAISQARNNLNMRSPDPASIRGEALDLYTAFREKLAELDTLSAAEKQAFLDAALVEIESSFVPAYLELIEYLEYLETIAPDEGGAGTLPDGEAYYAYALRHETSSDLTPDEVHELGLAEVARIQAEMKAVAAEIGYAEDISMGDLSEGLWWSSAKVEGDEALAAYEALIAEVDQAIAAVFDLRPSVGVEVWPEPTGTNVAYYEPPALDGSRPGIFFVNLGNPQTRYRMPSVVYHETIPGHHFQVALAQELDLPMFRRQIIFNAYAEGWALYAERLAWELGLYEDDPQGNLGRLQYELLRAARLAVDSGIHAKGWTAEQGRTYLEETTGWPHDLAQMVRYVAFPGQASGYKVGMVEILELRQMAMDRLGDKFDLKEFHNVVLGNGSVPLEILERLVQEYVEARLES